MPWGILIKEVEIYSVEKIPQNGKALDLLCGTGNLLGQLEVARPDITFTGVDLEAEYIAYAKKLHPKIEFIVADVLEWKVDKQYDAVLCTGGLHHLPYDKQESFIEKISNFIIDQGFAIVADPYIDDFSNEKERKVAAAKLGEEYLQATAQNGAPEDIISAARVIKENDVSGIEYKSSIPKMLPVFKKYFSTVEMRKTWPSSVGGYGDYYFILKK